MRARLDAGRASARAATHFYVYYRVTADTAAARARIRALMIDVEARTGAAGCLLARRDDTSTWMEVYAPVAHAATFGRTLAALATKHGAAMIAQDGKRHVESFGALPRLARRPQG